MFKVAEQFEFERFTGKDFKRTCVLNEGVTLADLQKIHIKTRRKKSSNPLKSLKKKYK